MKKPRLSDIRPLHGAFSQHLMRSLEDAYRRGAPVLRVLAIYDDVKTHTIAAVTGSHRLAAMKKVFGDNTIAKPEYIAILPLSLIEQSIRKNYKNPEDEICNIRFVLWGDCNGEAAIDGLWDTIKIDLPKIGIDLAKLLTDQS